MKSTVRDINNNRSKGFTLVEMIVATGVFATIMIFAVGALLTLVESHRHAQALQNGMNNLNSALEIMTRDIRFGRSYYCGTRGDLGGEEWKNFDAKKESTDGCRFIAVTFQERNDDGDPEVVRIAYYMSNKAVMRRVVDGSTQPITGDTISIDNLRFFTRVGGGEWPHTVIVVGGEALVQGAEDLRFDLQTTISQRQEIGAN